MRLAASLRLALRTLASQLDVTECGQPAPRASGLRALTSGTGAVQVEGDGLGEIEAGEVGQVGDEHLVGAERSQWRWLVGGRSSGEDVVEVAKLGCLVEQVAGGGQRSGGLGAVAEDGDLEEEQRGSARRGRRGRRGRGRRRWRRSAAGRR
jgi:hypothetical protein